MLKRCQVFNQNCPYVCVDAPYFPSSPSPPRWGRRWGVTTQWFNIYKTSFIRIRLWNTIDSITPFQHWLIGYNWMIVGRLIHYQSSILTKNQHFWLYVNIKLISFAIWASNDEFLRVSLTHTFTERDKSIVALLFLVLGYNDRRTMLKMLISDLGFQVSQKSGARVRVLSEPGEPGCKAAVCFQLQGSKEQILLARCVLENLVIDCEPVSEVLEVPQTSFGRIIGRRFWRLFPFFIYGFPVKM